MTPLKNIKIFVDSDFIGGKVVTEENQDKFSLLVSAIENRQPIEIVKVNIGDMIYEPGSTFSTSKNAFLKTKSKEVGINNYTSETVFHFISNSILVYVDILDNQIFEQLIAAYQSSPTLTIEKP